MWRQAIAACRTPPSGTTTHTQDKNNRMLKRFMATRIVDDMEETWGDALVADIKTKHLRKLWTASASTPRPLPSICWWRSAS